MWCEMELLSEKIIDKYVLIFIQDILNKNPKDEGEYVQIWNLIKNQNNIKLCSYVKRKGKTKGENCVMRAVDGDFCQIHKKFENFHHGNLSLINSSIDHDKNDEETMKTSKPNIKCELIDFENMDIFDVLEEIVL
jgi:hypothetical protein